MANDIGPKSTKKTACLEYRSDWEIEGTRYTSIIKIRDGEFATCDYDGIQEPKTLADWSFLRAVAKEIARLSRVDTPQP